MAQPSTLVAARSPAISAALRPVVRAYLLGYASSVGPRLATALLAYIAAVRRRHRRTGKAADDENSNKTAEAASLSRLAAAIARILRTGLELRRFPTFCATLIGGSTLLQAPLSRLLARVLPGLSTLARTRLSRWLASFLAAYGSLQLLQTQTPGFIKPAEPAEPADTGATAAAAAAAAEPPPKIYAGRTIDLTLFAVTRALDVVVGELWARRKQRRLASGRRWTRLETLVGQATDLAIFSASSALVMWAWFYVPERLPVAYNKWITAAAAVDFRLIEILRLFRSDQLLYGRALDPSFQQLQGMCADYDLPPAWADPQQTVPFPCTIVHMDCGPSCEVHALYRLFRSWRWAMATYLPLSLLMVLRKPNRNLRGVVRAVLSAARSSAFLGTFIMLFYYGVCLARTRIGPRIGPPLLKLVKPSPSPSPSPQHHVHQIIDSGVCTAVGCALCGWSILIERASRRKDMGLFVAPRALGTLFPRRYALDKQWRETAVFAASTAIVFTTIQENPKRVRGVIGSIISTALCQ